LAVTSFSRGLVLKTVKPNGTPERSNQEAKPKGTIRRHFLITFIFALFILAFDQRFGGLSPLFKVRV